MTLRLPLGSSHRPDPWTLPCLPDPFVLFRPLRLRLTSWSTITRSVNVVNLHFA